VFRIFLFVCFSSLFSKGPCNVHLLLTRTISLISRSTPVEITLLPFSVVFDHLRENLQIPQTVQKLGACVHTLATTRDFRLGSRDVCCFPWEVGCDVLYRVYPDHWVLRGLFACAIITVRPRSPILLVQVSDAPRSLGFLWLICMVYYYSRLRSSMFLDSIRCRRGCETIQTEL
jgi:hypothetical protein